MIKLLKLILNQLQIMTDIMEEKPYQEYIEVMYVPDLNLFLELAEYHLIIEYLKQQEKIEDYETCAIIKKHLDQL